MRLNNVIRKVLLQCISAILVCGSIDAQSVEVIYKVSQDLYYTEAQLGQRKVATILYKGHLLKSGQKHVSFLKPLYLKEYPDGVIYVDDDPQKPFLLMMDSIQEIHTVDLDSLIWRSRGDASGQTPQRLMQVFQFQLEDKSWEITPDTRVIGGMQVQKAVLRKVNSSEVLYEIWFSAEFDMQVGPAGTFNVPGLVVEFYSSVFHRRWILETIRPDISISDKIFWPAEFSQTFEPIRKLRRR